MRSLLVLVVSPILAMTSIVEANDSSALLEAGGIVLTKSADVSMDSEDLWIGRKKVRVSYVFTNRGTQDVKTRVAFPVPEWEEDYDGDIQLGQLPNPMNFVLRVDGKVTGFKTDVKRVAGKVKVTHHWQQLFKKGRSVAIEHEYVPVAGGFFTDTGGYTKGSFEQDMTQTYCVGPQLLTALKRRESFVWTVHYILKTGANWKGPIKAFKLTIAKDSPKDKVSVCIPDTKPVSPTTFEVRRDNFIPTQDLKILFLPAEP